MAHDIDETSASPFSRRRLGVFAAATIGTAALATGMAAPEAQAADKYNMGSATLYRSVKWQKKGNKYVTALQKALNDVHKAGLGVDGSFGVATERAVKSFQKSKKLAVDGRVGPATKRALNAAAGSGGSGSGGGATAPAPSTGSGKNYDMGSATLYRSVKWQKKGNKYVTALQKALNDVHKAGLGVDGSFGVATERAVKSFQKSKKLAVDGRVGPATKKSINAGAGSSPDEGSSGNYYAPGAHGDRTASGAGAILKNTSSGSALVNGTRMRLTAEAMVKVGVIGSVPRTSSLSLSNMVSSVKSFQRKRGLKADGVIGKGTWAQVNKVLGTNYPFNMDGYIAGALPSAKGGNAAKRISAMVEYFNKVKGSPYTWGGAGYRFDKRVGFDCSGLVYQMVSAGGIILTSTNPIDHARKSYRSTQSIYNDKRLRTYPLSQMRDGDIITFTNGSGTIVHDGIYYQGHLLEAYSAGVSRTKWSGGNISRDGYTRYVCKNVKRPFA